MRKRDRHDKQKALYDTLMNRIKNGFKPDIDLFEDDDHVYITIDAGYLNEDDVSLEVNTESAVVHIESRSLKLFKELDLPSKVDPETLTKKFKNGVLDVTIEKAKDLD